ncbi:MAG: hypothetical protein KDB07_10790 [Planctomycetes bacterium]|nr:hypothetical protein [Planctomycetota bacterium]
MSAIKKDKTQSHRFLELNWREDNDHDSSRNPVVEASQAVNFEEDDTLYVDETLFFEEDADTTANDSVVRMSAVSEVFDIVLDESEDAEPSLVADRNTESAKAKLPNLDGAPARVQIDQVFRYIAPYAAVIDNKISETSLLGRSLLAQANAVFNTAFLNLQAKLGYSDIYADTVSNDNSYFDITEFAIEEVMRLQRLV